MISKVYEFLFHPANVEAVRTRLVKDLRRVIPLEERVEHFFSRHEAWTQASPTGHPLWQASTRRPVFIDVAYNHRAIPS
jgi:hypothetical protein